MRDQKNEDKQNPGFTDQSIIKQRVFLTEVPNVSV